MASSLPPSSSTCCSQCVLLFMILIFFFPSQSLCMKFGSRFIITEPSPKLYEPPVSAPAPTSGGDLPKLPTERFRATGPSGSSLDPLLPTNGPASGPAPESDDGVPFITSNPAVPLPSDVTDTSTILPLPSRGNDSQDVGQGCSMQIHIFIAILVMIFSFCASARVM